MEKVSGKGDNSLQGLAEYLFSADKKTERKDFALHALEVIGSPKAYGLLIQYAAKANNSEYKAAALITLTNSYYDKASNEELEPTERILPLYEESLQDTIHSELYGRPIRDIAKEGIQKWTGIEAPETRRAKRNSSEKSSLDFSNKKASWNKEKKIFTFENGDGK